jgi:hypothetical protein
MRVEFTVERSTTFCKKEKAEMKKLVSVAIVAVFMLCMTSVALARGAPTREKAFSDQAIVSAHVAPVVANVPPMTTGYDVIENISTPAFSRLASANHYSVDTSATLRLSATVDWRTLTSASIARSARSGPNSVLVLRA